MTDLALDDLIKKDKQKNKLQGKKKIITKNKPRLQGKQNKQIKPRIQDRNQSRIPYNAKGKFIRSIRNKPNNNYQQYNNQQFNVRRLPLNRKNNQNKQKLPTNQHEDQEQEKGRTLKVMGLHPDFTNEDLYKLFSTEGALEKCLIQQDNFGRSMTTAIVKYHNAQSAKSAIQNLHQYKVMNSVLTVEPYKNKPNKNQHLIKLY